MNRYARRHQRRSFLQNKTPAQAYNGFMKHPLPKLSHVLAALPLLVLVAFMAGKANAQTATQEPAAAPSSSSSLPQKAIERIRTEDAGARIDEVRVGGETQSITVQPKTGTRLPAYEVRPSNSTKGSAPAPSTGGTTGSRVWNVLDF
jgi:cytoskeletal protein RodZ